MKNKNLKHIRKPQSMCNHSEVSDWIIYSHEKIKFCIKCGNIVDRIDSHLIATDKYPDYIISC